MKKQKNKQAKKASKLAKAENLKKKQTQTEIAKLAKFTNNKRSFIPICFITDDNYVIPTATAIQSLLESKEAETCYDIYIISTSLTKNNIEKFHLFASTTVRINIIQGSLDKYANLHKNYKGSFCVATPSALLKFEIPNFLVNYDKVIYLDGDILVKKDLSDLWNIDIKNLYVAAAYDTGRLYSKNEKFMIYPQYFNSGVMLLNLRLMREKNISQKLYEAKKKSNDMSLMDQNIFNQVLKDKIKNIDIVFNYLAINLHRATDKYDFQDINHLFNRKYSSLEDIEDKAYILHFSSKDKPWKYYNGEYSELWYKYFQKTPYKDVKIERRWKNSIVLSEEELGKRDKELIVSLTSYPARIDTVNQTIITLLDQNLSADKVILWLAPEQFPNREKDLPQELLDLREKGLTIDWYHDIKSYKKLIPALKKYPEAIIITADDDILYSSNWLQNLYNQYKINTSIIWTQRCHHIEFSNKKIASYKKWKHQISANTPEYSNFPTCGAGVLYPPHCFYKEVLREDIFMKYCPNADDIWFWGNLVLNNKKICTIPNNMKKLNLVEGSQETALWKSNVIESQNDIQLNNLIKKYPKILKILKKEQKQNQNLIIPYLFFPYYLFKVMQMRKKMFALTADKILSEFTKMRVDIKNSGTAKNALSITASKAKVGFINTKSIGQVVQGNNLKQTIKIKAINDGKLIFDFRGQDKRDKENQRIPLWCDYKSIKIDGKKINDKKEQTWHDKPYHYEMPVKDGQEVKVEIEQTYHRYMEGDLRDTILELFPSDKYVTENIEKLTAKIFHFIESKESAKTPKQKLTKKEASLKLFKVLPIASFRHSGGKKVWKIFGLPVLKKRMTNNGTTTKYYILGINLLQLNKKTTDVLR